MLASLARLTILLAAAAPALADERSTFSATDREIAEASAALGCTARRIRPLSTPHDGVQEVFCEGGWIIWMHLVDGEWTLRPHG